MIDGTNERGLGVGAFYFPGYAQYEDVGSGDGDKTLAPWELPTFLLGTCATVAEALDEPTLCAWRRSYSATWALSPLVILSCTDATGRLAVLEYVDGTLHVHDNPLGVFTNSPTFDWHMTNLQLRGLAWPMCPRSKCSEYD